MRKQKQNPPTKCGKQDEAKQELPWIFVTQSHARHDLTSQRPLAKGGSPSGVISPLARIHKSGNQEMENKMFSFAITPCYPLRKLLIPVTMSLYSFSLEVLFPNDEGSHSIILKVSTSFCPHWASDALITRGFLKK